MAPEDHIDHSPSSAEERKKIVLENHLMQKIVDYSAEKAGKKPIHFSPSQLEFYADYYAKEMGELPRRKTSIEPYLKGIIGEQFIANPYQFERGSFNGGPHESGYNLQDIEESIFMQEKNLPIQGLVVIQPYIDIIKLLYLEVMGYSDDVEVRKDFPIETVRAGSQFLIDGNHRSLRKYLLGKENINSEVLRTNNKEYNNFLRGYLNKQHMEVLKLGKGDNLVALNNMLYDQATELSKNGHFR